MTAVRGLLGKASVPLTTTNTKVYTVPDTGILFTTAHIRICSTAGSTDPCKVWIYIASSDTPTEEDLIENEVSLNYGAVLERTCILLAPGERIIVRASGTTAGNVNVRIDGLEQA